MFCNKCGVENAADAKFCKSCGQTIINLTTKENDKLNIKNKQFNIREIFSKKGLFIVFIVLIMVTVVSVIVNSATAIKLDDYIVFDAKGANGYGKVYATIDWDAIEEKYGDEIFFNENASDEYGGLLNLMSPIDVLIDNIQLEVSDNANLSNGDKISYTWKIDKDVEKYISCKLKAKGGTYTVVGLKEAEEIDVFEELSVWFNGMSSNGEVDYNYIGELFNKHDFICDEASNLKNGDTVTICLKNTDREYYAREYGIFPKTFEKEYVVTGLGEYISSYSMIVGDAAKELETSAKDKIIAYVENYDAKCFLSDLKYFGYILNYRMDREGYASYYNEIYIIFSGTLSHSEGAFETTTVFFPVKFEDVIIGSDGFTYDSNNSFISGYTWLTTLKYATRGYVDVNQMYKQIAILGNENYGCEVSDSIKELVD